MHIPFIVVEYYLDIRFTLSYSLVYLCEHVLQCVHYILASNKIGVNESYPLVLEFLVILYWCVFCLVFFLKTVSIFFSVFLVFSLFLFITLY